MKKRFSILIVLLIVMTSSVSLWWAQAVKPSSPSDPTPVSFVVSKNEPVRSIAERLYKQGLIRSTVAFFLVARFGGYGDKIQAGSFRILPSMNLTTVLEVLQHGTEDFRVTIPEGRRVEEVAILITKEFGIPEKDFLSSAREGYLFPDTYQLPKDSSGAAIAAIMQDTFQQKVNQDLIRKAEAKNLTLDKLITIASLIEREARFPEDRPRIASVILNRLKIGMKLDIDATVQYALGYQPKEKTWWKKDLTLEDINLDSPYNTYRQPGLPPTPIANPGLAAIEAVLDAPSTEYLYYVADASGHSHFATSLEEHNANIVRYLNK
jgi:UPF0755 protein